MSFTFENVEELISEFRSRIDRVALKLGRGVPEIGKELWDYWKSLPRSMNSEQRAEALEAALKKFEAGAGGGERRKTRSGTSDTERYGRILADKADLLEKALRRKNMKQIDRAARVAEEALKDVEKAIDADAAAEGMSAEDVDRAKEEVRAPVREMFEQAHEDMRQAAATDWAREARVALEDAQVLVEEEPDEDARDLTKVSLIRQIQGFGEATRQLDAMLAEGAAEGLGGHHLYEEICANIRSLQLDMAKAVKRLCELKGRRFGDGGAETEDPEVLSRSVSLPVSWLSRRTSSLSIGSTTSTTAASEDFSRWRWGDDSWARQSQTLHDAIPFGKVMPEVEQVFSDNEVRSWPCRLPHGTPDTAPG